MRNSLAMAGALTIALTALGCGGGGGGSTSTPTAPTGGSTTGSSVVTITITGQNGTLAFTPNPATVDSGAKVQFKNNDTVTHHIMLDDGSGQTADIPPGTTSAAISAGSNKSYHCVIHPGMVGGFNGSTGDPPPNCSYQYCAGYGGG
ncbi:MAG TPA: plastocyanin/azurin family copper-binding protein [Vicinamibacterales bacterium]|jgi:plastocyanin|nr:plastocyanin/azurin family copper-binding protein [Vicinamibacterales bacterium]